MDMRQLEIGMQAGYEDPKPTTGPPGEGHLPHDKEIYERVVATFNGARGVDDLLVWSARSRGMSERRILWRVVLPAALPQIAAGVRTAIAVAIIVLVSSEFISSETGLGYLIFSYGGVGADAAMLAVVIYLAVLGYLLDRFYLAGLRRLMAWHAFAH